SNSKENLKYQKREGLRRRGQLYAEKFKSSKNQAEMGSQTLKNVQKKFKLRGLALTMDALKAVVNFINDFTDAEDEALELVMDEIDRASLQAPVLDKESVEGVLNLLAGTNAENNYAAGASITAYNQSGLRIIDVFLVSKFCYDPIRKMFY
ncbi:hypothetical protein KI387_025205, partial [Taxus chinensis]